MQNTPELTAPFASDLGKAAAQHVRRFNLPAHDVPSISPMGSEAHVHVVPQSTHAFAATLPATGFLRVKQIIGDPKAEPPIPPLIPVSKSTWWSGVRTGRYPQPVKSLGARITAWRAEDIRALIHNAGAPVSD